MRNYLFLISTLCIGLTAASPTSISAHSIYEQWLQSASRVMSEASVDSQWYLPNRPPRGVLPAHGKIVGEFNPPAQRWKAGHRGIDIATAAGSPIYAAAAGTVAFAGPIAGRPVISIDHGGVRTTYEPVEPNVSEGEAVRAGQVIGTLLDGHCNPEACLHWGAKTGKDVYLDPRLFLRGHSVLVGPNPAREYTHRQR